MNLSQTQKIRNVPLWTLVQPLRVPIHSTKTCARNHQTWKTSLYQSKRQVYGVCTQNLPIIRQGNHRCLRRVHGQNQLIRSQFRNGYQLHRKVFPLSTSLILSFIISYSHLSPFVEFQILQLVLTVRKAPFLLIAEYVKQLILRKRCHLRNIRVPQRTIPVPGCYRHLIQKL